MFASGKKEKLGNGERIDTLIGEGTRLEGSIHTSDTTHVNGQIIGDIISSGLLIIGVSGTVEGNITSREVLVAGSVRGNLKVEEKLTITESGTITGDIQTKALVIDEGAAFAGTCSMAGMTPAGASQASQESGGSAKGQAPGREDGGPGEAQDGYGDMIGSDEDEAD